jgi:hypothetical protein
MPTFQTISRERHAKLRWKRYSNYTFAAADSVVPLVAAELPKAVMSLPMAFIAQGDSYVPVAVLGLQPGNNVFVAPDWRWVGHYIPAAFRSYPFRLAQTADGQQVLCIDEDSGLVGDDAAGEPFFTDDGEPAPAVIDILNFLTQIERSRQATATACAALQKQQLIRPWSITLKTETGEQQIAGLFQIDEAALNQLSAEALLEVRDAGALPIAYCQLLSMQHLPLVGQLIEAQSKASAEALAFQQLAPNGELDLEFFNKGGTISFAGLR